MGRRRVHRADRPQGSPRRPRGRRATARTRHPRHRGRPARGSHGPHDVRQRRHRGPLRGAFPPPPDPHRRRRLPGRGHARRYCAASGLQAAHDGCNHEVDPGRSPLSTGFVDGRRHLRRVRRGRRRSGGKAGLALRRARRERPKGRAGALGAADAWARGGRACGGALPCRAAAGHERPGRHLPLRHGGDLLAARGVASELLGGPGAENRPENSTRPWTRSAGWRSRWLPPGTSSSTEAHVYYFCCAGCRRAFEQEPEKYAAGVSLR